ncbi:MAG TPA: nucleoside 2-deoxyribosyltransferase [Pirellulales bacterium]
MPTIFPYRFPRRVYCAGPLFNAAERAEMTQIAAVLARDGFETFVPHADGMEFSRVRSVLIQRGFDATLVGAWLHRAIFALDTYQVVIGCGSLVFNMNGRVPDEGAVAEATMAYMLDKPVVIFKEDARSVIAGRDNPLVVGPADFGTTSDMEHLSAVLAERLGQFPPVPDRAVFCPAHLCTAVAAGERLWQTLEPIDSPSDVDAVADAVLALFGPLAADEPTAGRAALAGQAFLA